GRGAGEGPRPEHGNTQPREPPDRSHARRLAPGLSGFQDLFRTVWRGEDRSECDHGLTSAFGPLELTVIARRPPAGRVRSLSEDVEFHRVEQGLDVAPCLELDRKGLPGADLVALLVLESQSDRDLVALDELLARHLNLEHFADFLPVVEARCEEIVDRDSR